MPAPASYQRGLDALKRLFPAWPDIEATGPKEEAQVHATVLGRAADRVDAMEGELYPDAVIETLERWEKLFQIPARAGDSVLTRQTRLQDTVGRVNGNTKAQIAKVVAGALALTDAQVLFIETLRSQIDAALTVGTGTGLAVAIPSAPPGAELGLGGPWPGIVDDKGMRLFISQNSYSGPGTTATLISPKGTQWTATYSANGWQETRTVFKNEPAAGRWALRIYDGAGTKQLTEARLLVSNDVDAQQIYHFYVRRDPALAGGADLVEGQRVLRKMPPAHLRTYLCESNKITFDSPRSLLSRDPIGS